jgi:hypothetical protein
LKAFASSLDFGLYLQAHKDLEKSPELKKKHFKHCTNIYLPGKISFKLGHEMSTGHT